METVKVIPAVEARVHFGEIMMETYRNHAHFIVQKSGIDMVAIISAAEYAKIIAERERRFGIIDEIRRKASESGPAETEEDVLEAVKAARTMG